MLCIYERVIDFFSRYLRSDLATLSKIAYYPGHLNIEHGVLVFTLPDLKNFLDKNNCVSYLSFRQALYKHPTNQQLKSLGGKVVIHKQADNVDLTFYKLVHTK